MVTYVWDIETTLIPGPGKLPERVHCGVLYDLQTGETFRAVGRDELAAMGIMLHRADRLVGHNIARFDIPVLEAVFGWEARPDQEWFDTLVASNMLHGATLQERSATFRNMVPEEQREERLPLKLLRSHSLEAWGFRLGLHKAWARVGEEFWSEFSPEMMERCESDVRLNAKLYEFLLNTPARIGWPVGPVEPVLHDSRVAYIIGQQERNGIRYDVEAAERLEAQLVARRAALTAELRELMPAWISPVGKLQTPKRSQTRKPLTTLNPREWSQYFGEGCEFQRVELVDFNPGSTFHRAYALQRKYGWSAPRDEKTGNPKTDEEILGALEFPEAKLLLEYAHVNKRLGQLSEGKFAWSKLVAADGRIHGSVNCVGTRTSRMTHSRPNMAQIPSEREYRSLFGPTRPGWVQVGADASGLELRMLANRLWRWDGGDFAKTVLEGRKEDGTDVHSRFQALTGMPTRDGQKEWTYATLYGAGDAKRGHIFIRHCRQAGLPAPPEEKAVQIGRDGKAKLLAGMPAFAYLLQACDVAHERGFVIGLDGRLIPCKSQHGVLNDLLQSDGAIVMKHALLLLVVTLDRLGLQEGKDYAYMANVHDEWQLETRPDCAETIGEAMVQAIVEAGVKLGIKVPLDGEYEIGASWADTH